MAKTLVCTNVLSNVNSLAYGSHCQEWYRMGRNTEDNFILFHPDRFSIDNARNQAAKIALENECDFIYFLDDDMVLTPNTYKELKSTLVREEAEAVQALTFIRGAPFEPMFFKNTGTAEKIELKYFRDWEGFLNPWGEVEAYAIGFACALLRVETLKNLTPPYFITGAYTTEDVYYCIKIKDRFPEAKFFVNTRVPTGHILHPEVVTKDNLAKLKEYYNLEEKLGSEKQDRGEDYLNTCRDSLVLQRFEKQNQMATK